MKKVKMTFKTSEQAKEENGQFKVKKYNKATITDKEKEELLFAIAKQLGLLKE
ncbi:hypothetical protein [Sutcliffiella cohnii]|uniref:hypothetical protein n=1 Tax=Sutcliffiella cohnii TaxID=33932 RepID=UPI002E1DB775|nr:hypothetical protein [Sutcliffiella cohnii]